ncbi:TPA: site-specific DNA-methyltransferase [Yersinia enterocolitica]|nr:site-specific DNA-methyltransferase [Yersinia enterocolitica]
MADQSVHSCITSPPYYGLRDYGVEGQIGLEESPEAFIQRLVGVFSEVRRVLRDDGTLWVNMGDSWGKGKQLNGIPWRFAFALQNDGWILRQDIIWHKSNPMPESVRDRCTKAHEYIFLLSKSKSYYFDHEAIREPSVYNGKNSGVGFGHGMDKSDRNRGRISARDNFKREGSKRAVVIPGQNWVLIVPIVNIPSQTVCGQNATFGLWPLGATKKPISLLSRQHLLNLVFWLVVRQVV